MTRGVMAALVFVGVLLSLPLWLAPYPPLQDLAANTEVACQLLRLWRDEPAFSSVLWVHPQPWANSLPWILLAGLLAIAPSFAMTKLLLTLSLVAWLLSIGWMLARVEKSPWLALLCAPLAYDLAWSYGFFHFLLAKPLIPAAVALAKALVDAPNARRRVLRGALLGAALVVTFLTHSLAWLVACGCVVVVVLVHARAGRDLMRLVPVVLAGVVSAPFFFATRAPAHARIEPRDAGDALSSWWSDLGDQHAGSGDIVMHLVAAVALASLLVVERRSLLAWTRGRAALALCAALGLLAWLFGPPVLPQVSVVSPRLLSLALMFVVVTLAPAVLSTRVRALLVGSMCVAVVVGVVDLTRSYRAFSTREMGAFDTLLDRIPEGARVATHYASPFSPLARHNALWHWGKLACLERGAFTDDLFAYRTTAYVEVKQQARATFVTAPHRLKPEALARFDMLLWRGETRGAQSLSNVIEPVDATGSWTLYRVRR